MLPGQQSGDPATARPIRRGTEPAFLAAALLALAAGTVTSAPAAVYYVDRANAACSDSHPGTEALPYCTISAAAAARGGSDVTLLVKPAIYREQVTVPASGSPGAPFVIQALGGPVVVDGSDDFSVPGLWSPLSGGIWLASSVNWTVLQVVVDGARLLPSNSQPASLPVGTFRFIAGEGLYANMGGDNPGLHQTFVGRRGNGFRIPGRSWVVVAGFHVTRTQDRAIYSVAGSADVTIAGNTVSLGNASGIAVVGTLRATVTGNVISECTRHGIYLLNGTADSVVEGNESFSNARYDGDGIAGIKVENSAGNLVQRNRVHHNQDSGLQINTSSDTISRLNLSWANLDHGFDHLDSLRVVHVSDVAYGNRNDGFSFESASTDGRLFNSIAMDNGLTTGQWSLLVDESSAPGFFSSHNVFWKSNGESHVLYDETEYGTLAAFQAATGLAPHGLQLNPLFVDAAGADFRLLPGSPAIDAADASAAGWSPTDFDGIPRVDDPATANTGLGLPLYGDRGAFEFLGNCNGGAGPSPETCDGADNDCDGVPDNPAAPAGSSQLDLTSPSLLTWMTLPGATTWEVVRGSATTLLSSGGNFTTSTGSCLANDQPGTTLQDSTNPAPGQAFWYLVRGANCGGRGTWDTGSPSQTGSRDAEIDASPAACP